MSASLRNWTGRNFRCSFIRLVAVEMVSLNVWEGDVIGLQLFHERSRINGFLLSTCTNLEHFHSEGETTTIAWLRVDCDAPIHALTDLLANREANSVPLLVESLAFDGIDLHERLKYLLQLTCCYADALVYHLYFEHQQVSE